MKIGPFVINYISAMVRVSNERQKIKSPEGLEEMLLSDKAVFADIIGLSSDSLNTTFELLTGKSARVARCGVLIWWIRKLGR